MKAKIVNAVLFQLCWFGSVFSAANGLPWVGPVLVTVWLCWHLTTTSLDFAVESKLIVTAAIAGWAADSILVWTELIAFASHTQLGYLSPLWMVGLWAAFSATLGHSLAWLRGHWVAAAMLGAIAGPAAYRAGEAFGALSINESYSYLALAALYALATPLLLALSPAQCESDGASSVDPHKARGTA